MDEAQETKFAPVLTKKQLQRWQKSLLEVFNHKLLEIGDAQSAASIVRFELGENS